MRWADEWKPLTLIGGIFLAIYFLPVGTPRFDRAVLEAVYLARWYAREHVLLCLVPAFFIAGAIAVFLSEGSVIKYLGSRASRLLAYAVGSVSGVVLAVCSCTVLPLFAGIYRRGAGLGPAVAFLYSGPAINVLAIILTARILGPGLGTARAVGAVVFAIVIGLAMELLFRTDEEERSADGLALPEEEVKRSLAQNAVTFAALVAILVFANWGASEDPDGVWHFVEVHKWHATIGAAIVLALALFAWFDSDELAEWVESSWGFAKQILPLLLAGILVAGMLLGRPDGEGLVPSSWVVTAVGGNSWHANLFAAVAGAFMYFATLTEIPILQGLIAHGMGQGPALALLLAGPAVSLPNMLVISSVIGWKKTSAYVGLTVAMATLAGLVYGQFVT